VQPNRTFNRSDLGFFAVPRTWREIEARFEIDRPQVEADIRDAIIHVDDDGGLGFLHWHQAKMAWCLTARGRSVAGPRHVAAGERWVPWQVRAIVGMMEAIRDRAVITMNDLEHAEALALERPAETLEYILGR
jgi:hypothetical protein